MASDSENGENLFRRIHAFCICIYFIALIERVLKSCGVLFFFFNDAATTEIYPLSLHDALPISVNQSPLGLQSATVRLMPFTAMLPFETT